MIEKNLPLCLPWDLPVYLFDRLSHGMGTEDPKFLHCKSNIENKVAKLR